MLIIAHCTGSLGTSSTMSDDDSTAAMVAARARGDDDGGGGMSAAWQQSCAAARRRGVGLCRAAKSGWGWMIEPTNYVRNVTIEAIRRCRRSNSSGRR